MTDNPIVLKNVEWRLFVLMAEHGIKTATDLHQRLVALGIGISSDRITRIVHKMPDRINAEVLVGLMTVLDCTAADIIREVPTAENKPRKAAPAEPHVRLAATKNKANADGPKPERRPPESGNAEGLGTLADAMTGTKIRALPVKPRA